MPWPMAGHSCFLACVSYCKAGDGHAAAAASNQLGADRAAGMPDQPPTEPGIEEDALIDQIHVYDSRDQ
jgi:hypothetical protein